ncbi:MAG: putative esterase [Gemmataceae bacterium]|nr:putative esterase [Gemmataceae bacterium]
MPSGWTRTEIGGKPADVFDPPAGPAPRFALLSLHREGGDSLAGDPTYTDLLRKHCLPCVAPPGGQSWWADRVCPEFDPVLTAEHHLLRNVVPWMEARWGLGPRAVGVAGIGMGGQGAVRLGLKYPDRFPVVASVAGAFDYHERYGQGTPLDDMYATREQCRQDTAVLHIDPYRWPPHLWLVCDPADEWFRGNDRLHEKLSALGVPHTADLDTSTGDPRTYADRMAVGMIEFVVKGLERESRRLM